MFTWASSTKTKAQQREQTWGSFHSVSLKSSLLGSERNEKLSIRATESMLLAIYRVLIFLLLFYILFITHLINLYQMVQALEFPHTSIFNAGTPLPPGYLCSPGSIIISEVSHGAGRPWKDCVAREKVDGRARSMSCQKLTMGNNARSS